ncbi:AAA-like domain-containing protein [Sodalinema gerasimenkoae]|uniref:AAA-like domain-containing protein n=1 Tax=Sodalinema gerasimenkoae TaxID=2862348 RepID=UPI00135B1602|nr:AAA-like domain-containing protein [Sodalinema gerasimenkoae]
MADRSHPNKRRRGLILSSQGWQRLQAAEHLSSMQDNQGKPYTLEQLSQRTGLSSNTLTKLRRRQKPVDWQTLDSYFEAFHLKMGSQDVISPGQDPSELDLAALQQTPLKGQLPLDSPFYIYRSNIEELCAKEVLKPGALLRIKAPRQFGKTSLMAQTLNHARDRGFRTSVVNLQSIDCQVIQDPDRFLQWFCAVVAKDLGLPNELSSRWDDLFGSSYSCSDYFETYLLPAAATPLLLVIEELDELFAYPEIATDFFGMLRSWYEQGRYGLEQRAIWTNLRLAIIHSTEVWLPLTLHQSPFNVGLLIELPHFTPVKVEELTCRYGLNSPDITAQAVFALVGGHPYLTQLCLFYLAQGELSLEDLTAETIAHHTIFHSYLRRQLQLMEAEPDLIEAMTEVARNPAGIELSHQTAYRLQGLGAIRLKERLAIPSCELYRQYFAR